MDQTKIKTSVISIVNMNNLVLGDIVNSVQSDVH